MVTELRTNSCPKCESTSKYVTCFSNHWFDPNIFAKKTEIKHKVRCWDCGEEYEDIFHREEFPIKESNTIISD